MSVKKIVYFSLLTLFSLSIIYFIYFKYTKKTDITEIELNKTDEEVITLACNTLNIDIFGKNVYAQSKALLDNMNENDINIVKSELALSQSLDILD